MARKREKGGLFDVELPRIERASVEEVIRRRTWQDELATMRRRAQERAKITPPPVTRNTQQ